MFYFDIVAPVCIQTVAIMHSSLCVDLVVLLHALAIVTAAATHLGRRTGRGWEGHLLPLGSTATGGGGGGFGGLGVVSAARGSRLGETVCCLEVAIAAVHVEILQDDHRRRWRCEAFGPRWLFGARCLGGSYGSEVRRGHLRDVGGGDIGGGVVRVVDVVDVLERGDNLL